MSGILALVKLEDMVESGAMRVLVVCDEHCLNDVWEEVVSTFGARPAGSPVESWRGEVMVKRPSKHGVTKFVTIAFQSWKKTPRWSVYWDAILLISSATTLDKDREAWTGYLADYVAPGGEMCRVWRE